MKNIKKDLASIIKGAKVVGDICVAKYVNEQGNECEIRYMKEDMDEMLERVKGINKARQDKYYTYKSIQKYLAFLDRNRDIIQTLFDIEYLMKRNKVDANKACLILFENKRKFPEGFSRRIIGYGDIKTSEFFAEDAKSSFEVSVLIPVLSMLPKAWLKGIEIFEP